MGWFQSLFQGNAILAELKSVHAKVNSMSVELDALSANVDALITAAEAETTLLVSVKSALDAAIAAGNDGAALQALSDKLAAEVAKVNAAVAAASPPAPAI